MGRVIHATLACPAPHAPTSLKFASALSFASSSAVEWRSGCHLSAACGGEEEFDDGGAGWQPLSPIVYPPHLVVGLAQRVVVLCDGRAAEAEDLQGRGFDDGRVRRWECGQPASPPPLLPPRLVVVLPARLLERRLGRLEWPRAVLVAQLNRLGMGGRVKGPQSSLPCCLHPLTLLKSRTAVSRLSLSPRPTPAWAQQQQQRQRERGKQRMGEAASPPIPHLCAPLVAVEQRGVEVDGTARVRKGRRECVQPAMGGRAGQGCKVAHTAAAAPLRTSCLT